MNLGLLFIIFLVAVLVLCICAHRKIQSSGKKNALKIISIFIVLILLFDVIVMFNIASYGRDDTVTFDENAVIVLGAAVYGDVVSSTLKIRLDKAVEYNKINPDALIVVSGGLNKGSVESLAMEKYLIEQGVPKDKIITEERATSTIENMKYSKEILDELLGESYKTVIISTKFHIYRSMRAAEIAGFKKPTHFGAKLGPFHAFLGYAREPLALVKLMIFK
ncbi:MAG: YdcF family protein [Clostridia bacterium]|nr:YdcF family protein [Clostridia bacterium]